MARGTLYLDDGKSFDYKQGRKVYVEITWDNGKLESKLIESGEDLALIGVFASIDPLHPSICIVFPRHGNPCLAGKSLGARCKTRLGACTGG